MAYVLIVDDAEVDRVMAENFVHKSGHETELAVDGRDALEKMSKRLPDLVLTDLVMDNMDGLELVTRVRSQYPMVPVILMTGYGTNDTAVRALQAGADLHSEGQRQGSAQRHDSNRLDCLTGRLGRASALDFLGEERVVLHAWL